MPFRGTVRSALFLLLLGFVLYLPAYFWVNSHTFVPLNIPISLAPGRVQSPEFKINLEANFFVYARSAAATGNDCWFYEKLLTQSSVSVADQTIPITGASIEPQSHHVTGSYLGSFYARPGRYRLNVEVFSHTGEYDRCSPYLEVETSSSEYYEWQNPLSSLFTFCVFLEFIGIAMLLVFATTRSQLKSIAALRLKISPADNPPAPPPVLLASSQGSRSVCALFGIIATATGVVGFAFAGELSILDHQHTQPISFVLLAGGLALLLAHGFARSQDRPRTKTLIPALLDQIPAWGITGLHSSRRHPRPINPDAALPIVALICALTCFVWFLPMFLIQMNRHISHGLLVSIPRKSVAPPASLDGLTAPLVFIDAKGHVFLNYKPVTWDDLPAELDRALAVLPIRVVYFDGDPAVSFMEAAHAIDIIQGLGAKAILLLPERKPPKQIERLPPR